MGSMLARAVSPAGAGNRTVVSSFAPPELTVLSQSFFLGSSLNTMATSLTKSGITSKMVLLGTASDQILALDRRLLDPRRPFKPTPEAREEMLLPYAQTIPINFKSFITHDDTVMRLRSVVSSPAGLESSSLVLGVGVDLFFTRIAPSKAFDSLASDFSYTLLAASLAALVVATVACAVLVRRKEVSKKWD